jgi:ribulose-phosphate 3-epimerase
MVLNIKKYLKIFFKYPAEAIIFHVEACNGIKQIEKFLALIKKNGYKCGVAFKPQTDCLLYEQIFNLCDYLLILGVEPGFGGQKYQEATTKKLFGLKQIEKKALVLLDGGVNLDVIKQTSGLVDQYISGSFFMQASFAQKKNIIDTIKNMP